MCSQCVSSASDSKSCSLMVKPEKGENILVFGRGPCGDCRRMDTCGSVFLSRLDLVTPKWTLGNRWQGVSQELKTRLSASRMRHTWRVLSRPPIFLSVVLFLLLFYIGIPIWFFFCTWFRRHAVFLHVVDWPFQDFASPESYGLSCTRHFFVETSPGVRLGVWHVLPSSLHSFCGDLANVNSSKFLFDENDRPIVLYFHGSAESRTAAYRRSMYKVLSGSVVDAHVITFDYRGFGDSSFASPIVDILVEDASSIYSWLNNIVPSSRIYIWGHSLGTGVAIRLAEDTARKGVNPVAIVLEAPFTSVADVTYTFPLSFFHRHLPYFKTFCSDRTRHADTNFDSYERIGNVTAPLLILHAEDDNMVWAEQGRRLWKKAVESRNSNLHIPVFVELDKKYGCGHRNIHRAPNLPSVFNQFIHDLKTFTQSTTFSNGTSTSSVKKYATDK